MTCPKNLKFALSTVCCSVSSFSITISMRTQSLVLFSIHDILCIFLHIHISHALIFFFIFLVIVHVSLPYVTVGMVRAFTNLFFVSIFVYIYIYIFVYIYIYIYKIYAKQQIKQNKTFFHQLLVPYCRQILQMENQ